MSVLKRLLKAALVWILLLAGPVVSEDPNDLGIPDSACLAEPTYSPDGCSGMLKASVPVHFFTDWGGIYLIAFSFAWGADAVLDSVIFLEPFGFDRSEPGLLEDSADARAQAWLWCLGNGVLPEFSGPLAELVFMVHPGDSFDLGLTGGEFRIYSDTEEWAPTYRDTRRVFVAADSPPSVPGDADASGAVDIDDIIYLIGHVFSEGCPPYHLNSGDPNGSCEIDVDDPVFLIPYVLAGGADPKPGCVE
jgi:hypothetical protein